ncbi:uncharacterized protein [Neodiprion pinetum]|uniref:Pyrroline-5-carboxylate reductase n=1 Tax=Neodiprion lecontei TaxID=441921 RepID=A0ABM3G450_NEOLC|nr:uncharacterized protein LOC124217940 [Neodiprion pinetum]XP_046595043.1 uncharacterized protein LOC107226326 [Neodiprion lecontei]
MAEVSQDLTSLRVGFIGGGNMASAIGAGLIRRGVLKADNVWVSGRTTRTLGFWSDLGAHATLKNGEVVENTDVIFLAMKPQMLDDALAGIAKTITKCPPSKLYVSVLVGVTLEVLQTKLERIVQQPRVIRSMPNTPMMVGEGITVYCSKGTTANDEILVNALFSHVGISESIPETLMNAVGGLSGSGPAYAYLITEALSDGAVRMGVPRPMATKFAAQVLVGAGKMILETGRHPGQLKDEVCSPAGTTIRGIHALEQGGIRGSLMNAIEAAVTRSDELSSVPKLVEFVKRYFDMMSSSLILRKVCCSCCSHALRYENANFINLSRKFSSKSTVGCIGFIGGGNIARAIGNGILKSKLVEPPSIYVAEPYEPMQKPWLDLGTKVTNENGKVVENCDIIFLSVKTTALNAAATGIKNTLSVPVRDKLFISVLAGIPLSVLKKVILPVVPEARIIRSTLNMPLLIGEGCAVFSGDSSVTEEDIASVKTIMSGLGMCNFIPELQLNAASGLVGCGPAYMYIMIEALADGAVKMGVPRDLAIKFAAQTMYGSAKMVLETGKHPGELKDQVCSPGGTSIRGLHAMEKSGVRAALMDAIEEAVKRSEEITNK